MNNPAIEHSCTKSLRVFVSLDYPIPRIGLAESYDNYVFIYVFKIKFERAHAHVSGGGVERKRERENPEQAPHCQHRA